MTKLNPLALIAVTLIASFVSLKGLMTEVGTPARVFQILFAPITLYLIFRLIRPQSSTSGPITIYCLIVSAALVTIGLTSANSTPQLIGSLVFLPLVIYFLILLVWPRPNLAAHPAQRGDGDAQRPQNFDVDRRNFLKLLGGAGLLALLSGLFAKRADLLFPSPDRRPDQDSIESPEKSPTAGYLVTEIDDSETAHFGFTNKHGQWYIMKQSANNSYRYAKGDRDFTSNWTNRALLKYDYFENTF